MRTEFRLPEFAQVRERIEADLAASLEPLDLTWKLLDREHSKRMIVLAPKPDHCLLELLWRHRRGELFVEIPMVISNHEDVRGICEYFGIPFHHVPS